VLLTDDPAMPAVCDTSGSQAFIGKVDRYRYLTLEVFSTGSVAPGSFAISAPSSPQTVAAGSYAQVTDTYPIAASTAGTTGTYGRFADGSGTVSLDATGGVVKGSFDATLSAEGSGTGGVVHGTFEASVCGPLLSAPSNPCAQCPGF
jgi:hypothetical protein